MTCGGGNNVCNSAFINCAQGMDCFVDCQDINGCKNATINGPTGYNLSVECQNNNSCQYTNINGQNSFGLNVRCKDNNLCKDIIVYCPLNTTHGVCDIDIPTSQS